MKEKKQGFLPKLFKGLYPNRPGNTYIYGGLMPYSLVSGTGENFIREGYGSNADLYSVIDYILALAPNVRPMLITMNNTGDEKEISKHPFLDLLREPIPGVGYNQWVQQILGFRLITGNGYLLGTSPGAGMNLGKIKRLEYLASQYVRIIENKDKTLTYKYTLNGVTQTFMEDEIGHLKARQFEYGSGKELYGMSALQAGVRTLTSSNSGMNTKVAKFQHQGVDGILGLTSPDMGEEAVKAIKAQYNEDYTGEHRAGSFMVTNSDLTWQKIGLSPVDLQLLQSLGADLHTFCRMYRLDAKLVDPNAPTTYNNMREAKAAAYSMAVLPYVSELFNLLNRWVLPAYGQNLTLKGDYSQIPEMQKDIESMGRALNSVRWALSINEARWYLDQPPFKDPEADVPQGLLDSIPMDTPLPGKGYGDYRD